MKYWSHEVRIFLHRSFLRYYDPYYDPWKLEKKMVELVTNLAADTFSWRSSFRTLFWGMFGYGDIAYTDVIVDNTCGSGANQTGACYSATYHSFTEGTGYFLYALYHVIMLTTLLNMLIGIMANTLSEIQVCSQVFGWLFTVFCVFSYYRIVLLLIHRWTLFSYLAPKLIIDIILNGFLPFNTSNRLFMQILIVAISLLEGYYFMSDDYNFRKILIRSGSLVGPFYGFITLRGHRLYHILSACFPMSRTSLMWCSGATISVNVMRPNRRNSPKM